MSVIQKIQDKYAKLMAIIIAVALMTFVVMLAFENGGNLFTGGNSTTVGRVNGVKIDFTDFERKIEEQEKNMESRGMGSGSQVRQQAIEGAWNDEVNTIIENEAFGELGLEVGKKELGDVLYGPNAPEDLKKLPGFTDSATGRYNGQYAKQQIDALLKSKSNDPQVIAQQQQFIAYINYQEKQRRRDKYNSLLTSSINLPKWYVEKKIADESQMAKVTLVRVMYVDSAYRDTTKIPDKEIQDYLNKHKGDRQFKQQESRGIAYVAFSTAPSKADSELVRNKVLDLKPQFSAIGSDSVESFLVGQGVNTFSNLYFRGSTIMIPVKDSIFNLPVNGVYGPYVDGSTYVLAKLLGKRQEPEMVKVRHILISTSSRDPQTGQPIQTGDTAVARKLADSIKTAIANGSRFDSLAAKFSNDNPTGEAKEPGKFNKVKGGIYDSVRAGAMVPEFNDFIFGNPVGSKGVVKTDFGYHYVEILAYEGKTFSPAYKVAYLSKPIEGSSETETAASNAAADFAGKSQNQKSFDANAEKLAKEKGIAKQMAADILPSAYSVMGLAGQSRAFVKSIYEADRGDVLNPEQVGDNWVVAIVTEINEEGVMSVTKARPLIEPILRPRKIAEKIKQKIGNVTTVEAAAIALGKQVELVDSLKMKGTQTSKSASNIYEPRVIGAAFNPANKGKTLLIEGESQGSGVFVVRVENVMAVPVLDANVAQRRQQEAQMRKQMGMFNQTPQPTQVLREAATIKDSRIKFF